MSFFERDWIPETKSHKKTGKKLTSIGNLLLRDGARVAAKCDNTVSRDVLVRRRA